MRTVYRPAATPVISYTPGETICTPLTVTSSIPPKAGFCSMGMVNPCSPFSANVKEQMKGRYWTQVNVGFQVIAAPDRDRRSLVRLGCILSSMRPGTQHQETGQRREVCFLRPAGEKRRGGPAHQGRRKTKRAERARR
jgi:hypothetical protein